jgi:hypothetical protein
MTVDRQRVAAVRTLQALDLYWVVAPPHARPAPRACWRAEKSHTH